MKLNTEGQNSFIELLQTRAMSRRARADYIAMDTASLSYANGGHTASVLPHLLISTKVYCVIVSDSP